MKRFLIASTILTLFTVVAVGSSDATVIKKELTYSCYSQQTDVVFEGGYKVAFIYDAVVPASIVMPDMKLRYREFVDLDNSFEGSQVSMIKDRSPPKSDLKRTA